MQGFNAFGHGMGAIRCAATKRPYLLSVAGESGFCSNRASRMERAMREYPEDNFGARALNWIVIVGAALLFVLASFSSLTPLQHQDVPQQTSGMMAAQTTHT